MAARKLLLSGAGLLTVGLITCLSLAWCLTGARLNGVFSTAASDSPPKTFERFQCPLFLSGGAAAPLRVRLKNPMPETLDYSIRLDTQDFRSDPAERILNLSVTGNQSVEIEWKITPVRAGQLALTVQAVSNQDAALPGSFHAWPTSFRQSCGVLALARPLTGEAALLVGLAGVLFGAGLVFAGVYARSRSR